MFLTVEIDISGFEAGAKGMRDVDLTQTFRDMRGPLRRDQGAHHKAQEGPAGQPWAPLAPATIEARRKTGGRQRLLGRLPRSLIVTAQQRSVEVEPRVPWSPAHHFGDVVGRRSLLPPRPFIYVSDELAEHARQAILDAYVAGWNGAKP